MREANSSMVAFDELGQRRADHLSADTAIAFERQKPKSPKTTG
jgi:hypothetical protein